jgi:methylenetetrahydrofolate reductase (NADPH)
LGQQWALFYEPDTPSRKLISDIMEFSYLVNVVHNDFHDPDAIFKPFWKAGAQYEATQANRSAINGINGH